MGTTLVFDDAIFFNFILPPIIFSAGYNLRRRSFFKYLSYTLLYGILGTFINFVFISATTALLNANEVFSTSAGTINLTIHEILLFSSVISATDTLSALTFIKEEQEPKLFAVLFGEGVFNDGVSIVLYKIINEFNSSKNEV
jgi:NhaP-type Na+/H+ or K+/H+ antiporter